MKFDKDIFKNIHLPHLKKLKVKRHGILNPVREWATCLLVTASLAVTLFAYLGYDFYTQFEGIDQPITSDESVLVYRHKDAAFLIGLYDARKKTFESLGGETNIITPSSSSAEMVESALQGEVGTVASGTEPLAEDLSAQ